MIEVRQALLDDTAGISTLFRQQIQTWQRINARGQVENLPYEQLTIYERWTHGGMWMSIETGAIHLGRLLRGVGIPLVAISDGEIVGYMEAYPGSEPEPFGQHIHIAKLMTSPDFFTAADALMRHVLRLAKSLEIKQVTVGLSGNVDDMTRFYESYGLQSLMHIQRYTLTAKTGQVFYKIKDHYASSPAQIEGWFMPVGRSESAAYHWEREFPRHWDVIPEIAAQRIHRMTLNSSGQEAFIVCKQQLYNPRNAHVFCWTNKPLSGQLLSAIRDWAHREHYRTLLLDVDERTARVLGAEAETEPYAREVFAINMHDEDDE